MRTILIFEVDIYGSEFAKKREANLEARNYLSHFVSLSIPTKTLIVHRIGVSSNENGFPMFEGWLSVSNREDFHLSWETKKRI